jgi:ketosteroid isomerase-like protein
LRRKETQDGAPGASVHPHVVVARALWRAASVGDAAAIRRLLAPDVSWYTLAAGDLTGEVEGPDAVLDLFARCGELVDDLRSELIEIHPTANGAAIRYQLRARRGDQCIDTEVFLVESIVDGRVVDAVTMPVDRERHEAFWRTH